MTFAFSAFNERGAIFAMPANHVAPMSATDCTFAVLSGRKAFSFLSRTMPCSAISRATRPWVTKSGVASIHGVEVRVEVPELEHLNIAAPKHLIDVGHRDAAVLERGPDAFAGPLAELPRCGSSE